MSVISHTASGKPQLLYIAAHNSHWRMKCRLKKQKCLLILSNVTSTKLICASVLIIAQCSLKLRVWVNCRCNLSHLASRIIISSPSGCVAENFQFASWLGEWCARLDPFSAELVAVVSICMQEISCSIHFSQYAILLLYQLSSTYLELLYFIKYYLWSTMHVMYPAVLWMHSLPPLLARASGWDFCLHPQAPASLGLSISC